ncbi:S8 family serine peptidase [Streptomyces sp. R39]|uniref:S8 family serine peptidase n=1 Tax=Streptomyces sp. R39 TaxID=3238631 RepID=A0AB39QW97_9ACTN
MLHELTGVRWGGAPGCVSSAVAVGATTDDDQLSAFTDRGPLLDLLAPGTSIISSVPGGGYASKSGTSMAAPHVAGALAILGQAFPNDSVANLESRLESSGRTVACTGADTPRIDVAQALGATVQPATTGSDFNCDKRRTWPSPTRRRPSAVMPRPVSYASSTAVARARRS